MADAVKQKIADIEAEMAKTQKNKATATHLGVLKAKIAKLKKELLEPTGGGGGGGGERGFDVNKVGDARVGFVGFPSVGKSTLLTKLTGTESEAAAYEFTTLTAVPGITRYHGARIQMLDLPGIIEGAADGKGRGRQVISTARTSDLILIVLDVLKPITHKLLIEKELEGFGIRLNKTPPKLIFRRKERGGISFVSHVQNPRLTRDECIAIPCPTTTGKLWRLASATGHIRMYTVMSLSESYVLTGVVQESMLQVCGEYRIHNADIEMRGDHSVDDLVDVIEGNRIYIPCLYILNKIDQITLEELEVIDRMENYVPICAYHEWNLDGVLECVWDKLNLTRVYTKPKGKLPDFGDPVVLKKSKCTVEDFCNRIHKAIMKNFKYALVWGVSSKHRPQRVGKDHVLQDEDIVQIVKKV